MKSAIVLGGTHDHIRLIELLKERDYRTVLVDYLEDPPAGPYADEHIRESTLDLEAVLALADRIKPEVVITACIDQALLTMAYVCERLGLPCHVDYPTALALTHKAHMKRKFAGHGIPTSNFVVLGDESPRAPLELEFPLVVKPADSNSSKGVTRVNIAGELQAAVDLAFSHSRSRSVIVESFVEGDEFSVDVAVREFEPVVVMVTKNIKARQNVNAFTIVQSLFPATRDPLLLDGIRRIAQQIVHAYGLRNGPLLIQLVHRAGELRVIEFSARLGGGSKHHLVKKMTGFDLLEWFVDSLFSAPGGVRLRQDYEFACVNYLYARNGIIGKFVNFDELVADGTVDQYFFYKTPGTVIDNHISSADRPAGYMIVDNDHQRLAARVLSATKRLGILDKAGDDMIDEKINYVGNFL